MWPFKRKKTPEAIELPAEVQDYYQSATRSTRLRAILAGLAALAMTLVIGLGVFYGGRWVYRQSRSKPKQPAAVEQNPENTPDAAQSSPTNTSQSNTGAIQPSTTPGSTDNSSATGTTPASRLVNTGPDEDL